MSLVRKLVSFVALDLCLHLDVFLSFFFFVFNFIHIFSRRFVKFDSIHFLKQMSSISWGFMIFTCLRPIRFWNDYLSSLRRYDSAERLLKLCQFCSLTAFAPHFETSKNLTNIMLTLGSNCTKSYLCKESSCNRPKGKLYFELGNILNQADRFTNAKFYRARCIRFSWLLW